MSTEPLLCDLSVKGRHGIRFPQPDVPKSDIPQNIIRSQLDLPEISEIDTVRHFTRLSQLNYAIDRGFYPLGSCTMKYNPRINEEVARLPGFTHIHPYQPVETVQGCLALMFDLQTSLAIIGGFTEVSLQPAAGAHGELTGVLIIQAYHRDRGDEKRRKILIPDSAHGTNPATSAMANMLVVELPSDEHGNISLDALRKECDDTLAGLMITNPNTLGLFEEHIQEVTKMVHEAGGLVYGDGANLNALIGIVRPGDLGIDILHFNLHKTFSTPHGGGGPGSGPVGVAAHLVDFLPAPIVKIQLSIASDLTDDFVEDDSFEDDEGYYDEDDLEIEDEDDSRFPDVDNNSIPFFELIDPPKSIGRVKSFYGHFGIFVRAYTYIRMLGEEGLRRTAEYAVLNANYLRVLLQDTYHIPHNRVCKHEFVAEGCWQDIPDVHALDIAKRLIDYGYHPPTNYFPLIVHEALMIEPTETESKETLDAFAQTLIKISAEARENPMLLKEAPHNSPVSRLDEVKAAKDLTLCCNLSPNS